MDRVHAGYVRSAAVMSSAPLAVALSVVAFAPVAGYLGGVLGGVVMGMLFVAGTVAYAVWWGYGGFPQGFCMMVCMVAGIAWFGLGPVMA